MKNDNSLDISEHLINFKDPDLLPLIEPTNLKKVEPFIPFPLRNGLFDRLRQSNLASISFDNSKISLLNVGFISVATLLLSVRIGYKAYIKRMNQIRNLNSETKQSYIKILPSEKLYSTLKSENNSIASKFLSSTSPSNHFDSSFNTESSKQNYNSVIELSKNSKEQMPSVFSTIAQNYSKMISQICTDNSLFTKAIKPKIKVEKDQKILLTYNFLNPEKEKKTSDTITENSFNQQNSNISTSYNVILNNIDPNQQISAKTSQSDSKDNMKFSIVKQPIYSSIQSNDNVDNSISRYSNLPKANLLASTTPNSLNVSNSGSYLYGENLNEEDDFEEEKYRRILQVASLTSLFTKWEIFTLFFFPLFINLTFLTSLWIYFKWHFQIINLKHFIKTIKWLIGKAPAPHKNKIKEYN